MNYETAIRSSNTIFSTMVCPKCGKPIVFRSAYYKLLFECNNVNCSEYNKPFARVQDSDGITVDELCSLLNNNGINGLVQPNKDENSK